MVISSGTSSTNSSTTYWSDVHGSFSGQIHNVSRSSNSGTVGAAGLQQFWNFNGSAYILNHQLASIAGQDTVFNIPAVNTDFQVKSDGLAHALFVAAGEDRVCIGTSASNLNLSSSLGTSRLTVADGIMFGTSANTVSYIGTGGTTGDVAIVANATPGNLGGARTIRIKAGTAGGGGPTELATFDAVIGNIFNPDGAAAIDFRVRSNVATHSFNVCGSNGFVNIGTATGDPAVPLNLKSDFAGFAMSIFNDGNNTNRQGIVILVGTDDNSGTNNMFVFGDGDGNGIGSVSATNGTVSYNAFSASHEVILPAADNANGYPYGTLLETTSIAYQVSNQGVAYERGIRYNVTKSSGANSKAVLGAYSGKIDQEANLHFAYVLGDGHILCNSAGGNVAVGDGICTSATAGIGQKATASPSMIIGIAQEAVTFENNTETKLVAVQYGLQQFTPWS